MSCKYFKRKTCVEGKTNFSFRCYTIFEKVVQVFDGLFRVILSFCFSPFIVFPLACTFCYSNVTWVNIFVWNFIVYMWICEHNLQTNPCKISLKISHGLNTKQTGINLFVIWGSKVISRFANILPNDAEVIGWKCCATFSTNKTKKIQINCKFLAHISPPYVDGLFCVRLVLLIVFLCCDWSKWLLTSLDWKIDTL